MTNEEKAKEIEIGLKLRSVHKISNEYEAAISMAEWKDEQFIQMLPEIFDFFDNNIGLYDGGISHYDSDKKWFIDEFTNRILKK